jgi:hypothetical protein
MTKNNRVTATDPHINVIGHITAYELRALLDASDLYNGLVNRFLWCCARRTKIISRPQRMDESRLFQLAIKIAGNILKAESLGDEIVLDDDATRLWDQMYREISTESDTGPLGAATSRNEAHVRRVSALLAIIDGTNTVSKAHLLAAKAIADYSAESCRFLFTVPSTDAPDAQKLLTALANGAMTQTAISKLFNNHKSRQELIKLLGDLQSLNRIKKIKTPGSKTIHWQLV